MYNQYFDTSIPSSVDISLLQDGLYTPAEVSQVFLNNIQHPETALEQLISQTAANIRIEEQEKHWVTPRWTNHIQTDCSISSFSTPI